MPRPSGAPTAAANASATTTVSATTIVDVANLRDSKQTPQGLDIFQRLAIFNIVTIGPTEYVENLGWNSLQDSFVAKDPLKKGLTVSFIAKNPLKKGLRTLEPYNKE